MLQDPRLIVISSFIHPYRSDREIARSIIDKKLHASVCLYATDSLRREIQRASIGELE
ncbi:adenylyl-sulfate kinase [Pseudomonas sp. LABIM340]|uniref:adenylyl-sulfate kinase n=1 Tax=Pseudomonas sp. LABIM340 TaxID=3156585 RepID=UPI0032AF421E